MRHGLKIPEGKIKIHDFGRYLKKEKCEPMEETGLELTKATDLTTAELPACVEQRATAKNPKEVWNLLYEDTDATYESLAEETQLHHYVCYLRNQIMIFHCIAVPAV